MTSTGTVTQLKVWMDGSRDIGFVTLKDSVSGLTEQFVLWGADPPARSFLGGVERSMVTSKLRDALVNKLPVTVAHDGTSGIVQYVQLQTSW
jgi:hypothetical protein